MFFVNPNSTPLIRVTVYSKNVLGAVLGALHPIQIQPNTNVQVDVILGDIHTCQYDNQSYTVGGSLIHLKVMI